jgi:hypothetical protein
MWVTMGKKTKVRTAGWHEIDDCLRRDWIPIQESGGWSVRPNEFDPKPGVHISNHPDAKTVAWLVAESPQLLVALAGVLRDIDDPDRNDLLRFSMDYGRQILSSLEQRTGLTVEQILRVL